MIRCMHCSAETSNGLALCDLCQRLAQGVLEVLPIYYRNLCRWRPGRTGTSRPVPGSRVLYDGAVRGDGTGDRISDSLDAAKNALMTWSDTFAEARPYLARLLDRLARARQDERIDDAQAVAWLCAGFAKFLPSVATLDWCGELVRDLAHHEAILRDLTPAVPGWYAGPCDHCGASTYVMPGLTWNTCASCGVTSNASDHLETVLAEASDWLAKPKDIAAAIVALVHTEESVPRLYARIRQWAKRGELQAHRHIARDYTWDDDLKRMVVVDEEHGPARYRMGEVVALVLRDTRGSARVDTAV